MSDTCRHTQVYHIYMYICFTSAIDVPEIFYQSGITLYTKAFFGPGHGGQGRTSTSTAFLSKCFVSSRLVSNQTVTLLNLSCGQVSCGGLRCLTSQSQWQAVQEMMDIQRRRTLSSHICACFESVQSASSTSMALLVCGIQNEDALLAAQTTVICLLGKVRLPVVYRI